MPTYRVIRRGETLLCSSGLRLIRQGMSSRHRPPRAWVVALPLVFGYIYSVALALLTFALLRAIEGALDGYRVAGRKGVLDGGVEQRLR